MNEENLPVKAEHQIFWSVSDVLSMCFIGDQMIEKKFYTSP